MPHVSITRAQFRQDLKDKWESVPFWADAEANDAIQETLRVWNMLTGQWHDKKLVSTVADEPWISVPGTLTYSVRMTFNSYPMYVAPLVDADYGQENWEGQTTSSSGVPDRPTFWIPSGLDLFAIWPADASGGNSIEIDGIARTPVLATDADFVDIGEEEYSALLGEALHIASFKAGSVFLETTKGYHDRFLKAAFDKNVRLKASTFFRKAMGLDMNRHLRPVRRLNTKRRSDEERERREDG